MKIHVAIDRPSGRVPARVYDGWLEVIGWAAGEAAIDWLGLRLDEGPWQEAIYGGVRPDVAAVHPGLVHAARSGFRAFVPLPASGARPNCLEVQALAGGERHKVQVPFAFEVRPIALQPVAEHCVWCETPGTTQRTPHEHGPFRVFRCATCDYAYAGPWPSAADLAMVYAIEYWDHAPTGANLPSVSRDTAFVHDTFTQHGNGGRRALEVGCGQGTLLHGLHALGYQVTGQDLSHNAAREVEDALHIPIHRGALREAPAGTFDLIVSRHVLEHSTTPRQDLAWMQSRLAKAGVLLLVTPNWDSLAAELLDVAWEWFVPPIHLSYFTPRSLRHVLASSGLELLAMRTRQGDGADLRASLHAQLDYRSQRMPAGMQARLRAAADGTAIPGAAPAREQEVIAVLRRAP